MSRRAGAAGLLVAAVCLNLAGCATRSSSYPKLAFVSLSSDREAPQAAGATIRWRAETRGGVGDRNYEFRLRRGDEEIVGQSGPAAIWDWTPSEPGEYAIRVTVRDSLGYVAGSGGSESFRIAPELTLDSLTPNLAAPQRARAVELFWRAVADGGVGPLDYEFRLDDGNQESEVQAGPETFWAWIPPGPGTYRVKAIIRDRSGRVVDGGWSDPYVVTPALHRDAPIAVLPFENLTGQGARPADVRSSLRGALIARGVSLLDEQTLDQFMARHRIRHVGGITPELGQALEQETGAIAVLVGSVEQLVASDPPRISLHTRLVSTGPTSAILWMRGDSAAGHDSPGWLELNLVHTPEVLIERQVARISEALHDLVTASERPARPTSRRRTSPAGLDRRFRPIGFHRSPEFAIDPREPMRIAVLPFDNESGRADAGRLMTLHFVRRLSQRSDVDVVEPGRIRQTLLQTRLIFEDGPSLPQTDLLRTELDVDLVITGTVTDYQDPQGEWGEPVVGFSVRGIEARRRRVAWTSISRSGGDDGVFFFGLGKVYTAHDLADRLVAQVVARAMAPGSAPRPSFDSVATASESETSRKWKP